MANSSNLAVSFFFTSLSVLLFIVSPLHAISPNDEVISNICPKTRNPPFCSRTLQSAYTTDLKTLASYALNLAGDKAAKSLILAKSLAGKTADLELKKRYSSCSENYDEAIGDIKLAQQYLTSGDYNGVNVVTTGVMTQVDDCQDSFKQPPAYPSSLPKSGKRLKDICSIVLVISNILPKPM